MLEAVLLGLLGKALAKVSLAPVLKGFIGKAVHLWSLFDVAEGAWDCIEAKSYSDDLGARGITAVSGPLSEYTLGKIINIGEDRYRIEKRASGLFVASNNLPQQELTVTSGGRVFLRRSKMLSTLPPEQWSTYEDDQSIWICNACYRPLEGCDSPLHCPYCGQGDYGWTCTDNVMYCPRCRMQNRGYALLNGCYNCNFEASFRDVVGIYHGEGWR